LAAKKRVHELAKELGMTNKETLDLSLALGIGVKTHSSGIEEAQADRVRRRAEREGLTRPEQPEEPKPVKAVKGGGKAAAKADTTADAKSSTAGAETPAAKPAPAKPAAAKATISAEAQAALTAAQADVKAAKAQNALWTTADAALKAAEEAAAKGDSATVLKQAKLASDHVKKGMAQLNYPMLKVGD